MFTKFVTFKNILQLLSKNYELKRKTKKVVNTRAGPVAPIRQGRNKKIDPSVSFNYCHILSQFQDEQIPNRKN